MKFTITLDIENCFDCPLQGHYTESGGPSGNMCNATTRIYPFIDYEKVPEWCPLREENKEERVYAIL